MAEDKIISEGETVTGGGGGGVGSDEQIGFLASVINEIIYSPLNLVLVAVITVLIYKIFRSRQQPAAAPPAPELPRLRKDFTVAELRQFDGTQADGRVLVAVNGSVYDVTKGKRFYGPGGPYAAFGGRDASRGLATFSVTSNEKEEYDDLSDLTPMEMESVREWEMQFKEKYLLVGRLLKPGEQPTNYSDEDEDTPNESTPTAEPAAATTTDAPPSPKPESKASDAPSKAEDVKSAGDAKAKDEWRPNSNRSNKCNNNSSSASSLRSDVEDGDGSGLRYDGGCEGSRRQGDCGSCSDQDAQESTTAYLNDGNGDDEECDVRSRPFDQHSICDMFGF